MIRGSFVRVVEGEELHKELLPQLTPESLSELMITLCRNVIFQILVSLNRMIFL